MKEGLFVGGSGATDRNGMSSLIRRLLIYDLHLLSAPAEEEFRSFTSVKVLIQQCK